MFDLSRRTRRHPLLVRTLDVTADIVCHLSPKSHLARAWPSRPRSAKCRFRLRWRKCQDIPGARTHFTCVARRALSCQTVVHGGVLLSWVNLVGFHAPVSLFSMTYLVVFTTYKSPRIAKGVKLCSIQLKTNKFLSCLLISYSD